MLTATIIDDEPQSCVALASLLNRYFPQIKVADVCHSANEGLNAVEKRNPDILFLDIEMPHKNGFQLLEELPEINFELIFTTIFNQQAIRDIRFSAMDFLLKPIDARELQTAVEKVIIRRGASPASRVNLLIQRYSGQGISLHRVAIPTPDGLQMVPVAEIIRCSASRNYSILFLKDGQKLFVSRPLKELEDLLADYAFFRVHHSFLVNLNEVEKYTRGEGGILIMSDKSTVDVSRSRKEPLLNRLFANKR